MSDHKHSIYERGKFGAWIGIISNTLLAGIKFTVGLLGRSTALMADAVHTFSDIISSVVVLIGMDIAAKPADKEHPYGHGRAESVAGAAVALLLVALAVGIGFKAVNAIANIQAGEHLPPAKSALWVALLSFCIKEILFRYKIKLGKKIQSSSIVADAWHHRSDAFSSLIVVFGIGLSIVGGPQWRFLDNLAAVFVALIITWTGIELLGGSMRELMDRMPERDIIDQIRRSALSLDDVLGTEKITARKAGMDLLIDIHIEVDPLLTVKKSHGIAQEVRDRISRRVKNVKSVLVHIEPYSPTDEHLSKDQAMKEKDHPAREK